MNVETTIRRPARVKLTVSDFLLLKESGAFAGFSKTELLEGKLSGVPVQGDEEPESDASIPIKLRVADYLLLDQSGAFQTYPKTELIDGVVYAVNPQHRLHGFAKDELAYRLRRSLEAFESPLHVATEQSVEIIPYSDLQPDIILTTEPRGPGGIPSASVALIVEVAASTKSFDLTDKARIYASAYIAEYWVVDMNARVIHQMWAPGDEIYAERREVALGERMDARTIRGLSVETNGI